jgi:hypothetical protein
VCGEVHVLVHMGSCGSICVGVVVYMGLCFSVYISKGPYMLHVAYLCTVRPLPRRCRARCTQQWR